jgi:plasmid stabilization system protein ParE
LLGIYRYIAVRDPFAAEKIMKTIAAAARRLAVFPQLGRPSDRSDVRLLQVPGMPYLLPYRVAEEEIEIIAVFDEWMERPPEWT